MAEGWVKIYRSIFDNDLWNKKPFSQGQAWIDLILLANYEDKKAFYKGEVIDCKRGDVNLSIKYLSERWGWSRDRTRNFLYTLNANKMATINATTNRTTITIENYSVFQDVATTNTTTNRHQTSQRTDSELVTTKNIKKNKKEEDNSAERFGYFIDEYGERVWGRIDDTK